ncbi:MAG: glycoside hydrolase family 3 C-terminal domain-containing protein [Chitinivibrionales bacterium]
MIKALFLAVILFCTAISAAPTAIDTVLVPVKIVKLQSITIQGGDTIYDYYGKINYFLSVGDQDSLNVGLDFVPVGGGSAVTPYQVTGDAGIRSFVNGINGQNSIYFRCKITGKPSAQYTARVTMTADTSRIEKITDSLVNLMTTQEKVDQLHGTGTRVSPDNTRLNIPGYYMTNGPTGVGVGASGTASAFPSPAAVACTFDTALIYQLGAALGEETWAKDKYIFEAPMINMVRDPRGGRDWEMFGEDPYLAARTSVAYCCGVQSVNCIVMPKHFICNDMETNRSGANAYSSNISERTLREIYAMPFEYTVREAKPWSIMSAYNKVNGLFCSDNAHNLTDILKTDWGFRGFVGSDWNSVQSTVAAANAGQDLEMPGDTYFGSPLLNAVTLDQVSADRLNDMAKRVVRAKTWAGVIGKLGAAVTQYSSDLKSSAHQQLALQIARESIVLVKNEKFGTETAPVLPLDKSKTVAIVGPYANIARLDASGSGRTYPYLQVPPAQGITAKLAAGNVLDSSQWQAADAVIAVLGVSGEGEGSDRNTATLEPPSGQLALVNAIVAAGKKCVVVLTGGSAAVQDVWSNVPAVVVAWYPGEEQGDALADLLYGDVNPSGRLSATWPAAANQLPTFFSANSAVAYEGPDTGRGYRYDDRCNLKPLYPFGHGLSYSKFQYSNLRISNSPCYVGEDVVVSVDITDSGAIAGDEVAQLYVHENAPDLPRPVKELRGFARVTIAAGATRTVSFTLREREFAYWDTTRKAFYVKPDDYTVFVGPSSANLPVAGTITLQSPW